MMLHNWSLDCGLMTFLTIFRYITAASSPTHVFPGFLIPVLHTFNIHSKQLAAFPHKMFAYL